MRLPSQDNTDKLPLTIPTRLAVFSDDWGRHPSSSQHLIRELLWYNKICCRQGCPGCREYQVVWVNTLGTRTPELSRADLIRAAGKIRSWVNPPIAQPQQDSEFGSDLKIVSPKMWPGFRRPWQRRLNAAAMQWHVEDALGRRSDEERIAITTIPITADLVGRLDVDRWIYYCVDDFSQWPGLDSQVMQDMEAELVAKVDDIIVVSQTLQDRITQLGRESTLITHGIDTGHWKKTPAPANRPVEFPAANKPVALFWGLIDQRLDVAWCKELAQAMAVHGGSLILAGPQQSPDPELANLPATIFPGRIAYEDLPNWAAHADVLVMPYADAPVTRAMQPLKLKEYLATMKPVVVRDLPATRLWCDAADVVSDSATFTQRIIDRLETGLPDQQAHARQRLTQEKWSLKADQLKAVLNNRLLPKQTKLAA